MEQKFRCSRSRIWRQFCGNIRTWFTGWPIRRPKCVSDAEDVYQEVFLQYVKKNPVFASEEHRKAWLLKVTVNYCKKLWRSAWRRKTTLCETVPEPVSLAAEHKFLLEAFCGNCPYRTERYCIYFIMKTCLCGKSVGCWGKRNPPFAPS